MKIVRRSILAALAATVAAFPAAWAARNRPQVCQKAIDYPTKWGQHLKHVMHDSSSDDVTWTMKNGATITYDSSVVPQARTTGEIPKGFPIHALGKISARVRLSCHRHGFIAFAAALLMWVNPGFAQNPHQYNPPSRPWAADLDGFTYLHQVNPLANAPVRSHQLHWHGVFKLSRYQPHDGGGELIQSEFPQDESKHSVDISYGPVDVFRNYVPDGNGGEVWDGTWFEDCGPKSNRGIPCRGALTIVISGDEEYQNSFFLTTPYAMVYDGDDDAPCWPGQTHTGDCWHHYDIWLDTDYQRSGYYAVLWAIDGIAATAMFQGEQDTGDNIFRFIDAGSFHQPVYFPVDAMYWRQFNDNIENVATTGFDRTCPRIEVAEQFLAMNMANPLDPSSEYLNQTFTWEDGNGQLHPSNLGPGAQYPYGYVAEVFNIGDYLWYPIGTAPQAWSVEGYSSSEIYNQGYLGGQLTNAGSDPF